MAGAFAGTCCGEIRVTHVWLVRKGGAMDWHDLLLIPLGVAVGAFGTLVGAGGGFVLVPVLLLLYPQRNAETITSMPLLVSVRTRLPVRWRGSPRDSG